MKTLLDFLDKIEGDGYGGMASFEIARSEAREALSENEVRYQNASYADENARLKELMTRAEYYINRLEAAYRGHVVRDLDEAHNAWETHKRRIGLA